MWNSRDAQNKVASLGKVREINVVESRLKGDGRVGGSIIRRALFAMWKNFDFILQGTGFQIIESPQSLLGNKSFLAYICSVFHLSFPSWKKCFKTSVIGNEPVKRIFCFCFESNEAELYFKKSMTGSSVKVKGGWGQILRIIRLPRWKIWRAYSKMAASGMENRPLEQKVSGL